MQTLITLRCVPAWKAIVAETKAVLEDLRFTQSGQSQITYIRLQA